MRLCKIALLASAGFFLLLVVFNNVFDYPSNYGFVQHVLSMDTLFSKEAQAWRSFRDPSPADGSWWFHHAFYWSIITWEALACALVFAGAWKLWKVRTAAPADFNAAKSLGAIGLTVSMLQWFVAFISVGGEWFLMWQSKSWNGQDAAFRMFACLGIMLIFLNQKDEEA
ncbi:MAG: DUF2165 domain-containing protein [Opitutaceae bacterium]